MSALLTRGVLQQVVNAQAGGTDVTPDAVNWVQTGNFYFSATTNTQTITGINTDITLRIEVSVWPIMGVNDVYFNDISIYNDLENNQYSLKTVSNNTNIYFSIDDDGTGDIMSFTIKNVSDNNTILDTFTLQALTL